MKLLVLWHERAQAAEAIVLFERDGPAIVQVVSDAAGWIVFESFQAAGVIRIDNRVVDQIPPGEMKSDEPAELRSNPPRFPVKSVYAELEVESVKEFVV